MFLFLLETLPAPPARQRLELLLPIRFSIPCSVSFHFGCKLDVDDDEDGNSNNIGGSSSSKKVKYLIIQKIFNLWTMSFITEKAIWFISFGCCCCYCCCCYFSVFLFSVWAVCISHISAPFLFRFRLFYPFAGIHNHCQWRGYTSLASYLSPLYKSHCCL